MTSSSTNYYPRFYLIIGPKFDAKSPTKPRILFYNSYKNKIKTLIRLTRDGF